jgi:uncharacterized repeat protein (TIGR03803 family)
MANRLLSCVLLSGAAVLAIPGAVAQAKSYTIIHEFAGGSDGSGPFTPPVLAASGDLYGTTNSGGSAMAGTIYRIAPDGTETVLHSFDGGSGGKIPDGAPVIDPVTGDLYGTTRFGGIGSGYGILWKLTARGKFEVLHSFDGSRDGKGPGQLIRDSLGNYYGVAATGGAHEYGTLYSYGADGRFTVLHAFTEKDGADPAGRLIRDRAGNLYGATEGAIYKLGPDGTFKVLYAFTGGDDGGGPDGGLARDKAGNLYGTAQAYGAGGYGTAFKLTPRGKFTVLHAFTGKSDGGYPGGDLLRVGNYLYGTAEIGGDRTCSCGLVFKMTLDGKETVLHAFTGGTTDGNTPFAGVTKGKHGLLYGTTGIGGANNLGIVFSIKTKVKQ